MDYWPGPNPTRPDHTKLIMRFDLTLLSEPDQDYPACYLLSRLDRVYAYAGPKWATKPWLGLISRTRGNLTRPKTLAQHLRNIIEAHCVNWPSKILQETKPSSWLRLEASLIASLKVKGLTQLQDLKKGGLQNNGAGLHCCGFLSPLRSQSISTLCPAWTAKTIKTV